MQEDKYVLVKVNIHSTTPLHHAIYLNKTYSPTNIYILAFLITKKWTFDSILCNVGAPPRLQSQQVVKVVYIPNCAKVHINGDMHIKSCLKSTLKKDVRFLTYYSLWIFNQPLVCGLNEGRFTLIKGASSLGSMKRITSAL